MPKRPYGMMDTVRVKTGVLAERIEAAVRREARTTGGGLSNKTARAGGPFFGGVVAGMGEGMRREAFPGAAKRKAQTLKRRVERSVIKKKYLPRDPSGRY